MLLMTVVSCGSDNTEEEIVQEDKFISFAGEEFELSFPSEWVDATESNPNVNFVVAAPPDEKTDKFTENVSVVIQPLADSIDAKRYLKLSEAQMIQFLPNHVMINKEIVKKHGVDCVKLEYQLERDRREMRYLQEAYITNGKVYLVTFTAEQIIFKEYLKTAQRILDSFKIK